MKTKLFTGLALAAALLLAGPAYAKDNHRGGGGGRGHAVAAVHRGGGGARIAASHRSFRGGGHANFASRRTFTPRDTRPIAANRNMTRNITRNNVAGTNVARNNLARTSMNRRNSMAFGGNNYANNNGGRHYQYAFASRAGWDQGREYAWHGHHYRWFNNGWFIIDPYPWVAGYYGTGYDNGPGYYGSSVSVQVQQALSQQGYYNGPIDGVVGPGTSAAITAYQQNNGLPATGTITAALVNTLGIGD